MTLSSAPRIGLIGLGRMGARIAAAAQRAGMNVVAALDTAPEPFALGDRPELRAVLVSEAEKFWATDFDLLAVATTAPSHVPLVREGLRRGIRRFMVEKPFADSVAEARKVFAEADALGARIVVNHGRRYSTNYHALAGMDGTAEMGELRAIVITLGGGSFGCVGVHFFDLASQLMGASPESVVARLTTPQSANPRGAGFDDPGGTAVLFYPGGRRALIDMGDDVGVMGTIEARFSRGRVVIEAEAQPWRVLRRRPEDRDLPMTRYGQPLDESAFPGFRPFDVIDFAHAALVDAMADGPVVAGAEAALGSMETFAAIRWSHETGQTVTLPLPAEAEARVYAIP